MRKSLIITVVITLLCLCGCEAVVTVPESPEPTKASEMPAGTVLFTSRAPVGTVAIAMNDICTNQGFKSVIPKKEIGTAFVYYFLKENKQLIERHASGTTFMEVSGNVLKSIPAIVPKPEVASRFAAICMPLFEEQRQNELEIGRLQELRQTLISSISSR